MDGSVECFSEMKTSEEARMVWSVPMGRHSSDSNLLRIKYLRTERKERKKDYERCKYHQKIGSGTGV